MKKLLFVLLASAMPLLINAQTDLATWNLTSNSNPTSINSVAATTIATGGITTNYSATGFHTHGWTNEYASTDFFQISIKPNDTGTITVTGINFNQTRNGSGPTNYKIKYYISNSNSSITDVNFLSDANNGDVTWVSDAVISTNGTVALSLPSALTLTNTQELLIRFYARGGTNNTVTNTNNWTILANSLKVVGNCVPSGTQGSFGTNSWYGSVYTFNGSNPVDYLGFVTETENFDRNNIAGGPSGVTANLCTVPTDNFFIRYKMKKNFAAGQYSIRVGADDGYRFSIDGGTTWIDELSNYVPQNYASKTHLLCLNGNVDLVLEYFENGGNSRVSFEYNLIVVTPPTSLTNSGSICLGGSRLLTVGGTGPFEWGSGTVGENIFTNQTGNSITVSPSVTTTYWVRRKITSPCLAYSNALTSTVTVFSDATAPISITSTTSNCPGAAVTLTAVGGTGNTYQWGTGSVGSNIISGATGVSVIVNPTNASTTYWVRRMNVAPCSGPTTGVTLTYNLSPIPGDQTSYGNGSWIGYVYNSTWANNTITVNNYLGYVTESETFNRNIGTGNINGSTAVLCSTPNENFFVRYKMRKTFAPGQYTITIGADDGYRFSIDGGITWISQLSSFVAQSYGNPKTYAVCLNGSTDMVIEYFENTGESRVSFTYIQTAVNNPTSLTNSGSICLGGSRLLTVAGTGPFEWGSGTVGENIFTNQTGNSITVSPSVTTTYWVRRKITSPCLAYSNALTSTVTVFSDATAPTSITSTTSSCPGAVVTLTAVGGTGNTYQWGTGSVGSNIISGATGVSVIVNPTNASTTYWVRRMNVAPCSGPTTGVTLTYNLSPIPGDQTSFGNESWIGYVYNSTWSNNSITVNNYIGYVTETEIFDRDLGAGNATGVTAILCSQPNEYFFIRYKMRKIFAPGQYSISVGADDGYRFSIDGGVTWVSQLSSFNAQSYGTPKTHTVCLNGSTDLVLEYFENAGDSRVSFTYTQIAVTAPSSITSSMSICLGGSAVLTAVGTGTFEWGSGTVGENIIANQTGNSITVSPLVNTTYWVRKKVVTPCLDYSTALTSTITVIQPVTAPTSIEGNAVFYCTNSSILLTANGGTGVTYQWGTGSVVGSNIIANQSGNSITVSPSVTTTYWVRRLETTPCSGSTNGVFKTITLSQIPSDPSAFGDNEWNVYGFNSNVISNPTNYRGFYTQDLGTNLGFESKLKWNETLTPSSALDWQGCSVNSSNYTFIHKRKGFPCGQYQLSFLYYDDNASVTVTDANGVVWTQTYTGFYNGGAGLSLAINGTTSFALDANSTIEVRTVNNNGDSKAGINISAVSPAIYENGIWDKTPSYSDVQINDNLTLAADLTVCSCTLQEGKTLTIEENKSLVVLNNVVVANEGKIIVENNGSFVQVDDLATYTGNNESFLMKRHTQPVYRLDYTYWASPIKAISNFTLNNLSPLTLASKFYKWNDTWIAVNSNTEVMVPAKGYIVRAPQNFDIQGQPGAQPAIFQADFKGQPNNGIINIPVNGNLKWNLIGNPYPSALNINAFYNNTSNQSVLDGTIYLWTHNTPLGNINNLGNYNYSPSDYASYNMSGGTATAAASEENFLDNLPTGYVAAGQSFFVQGRIDGMAEFNNSMRVREGGLNNQFFRNTSSQQSENTSLTEKHRVWLNLTSAQNDFNQMLLGYIENATNDLDWGYDGVVFSGSVVTLYSVLNNKSLSIQGKALPFSNQDQVQLGYQTTLTGSLKIAIGNVDGLLENQDIYLQDNLLNVVHNLKESDYTFLTSPGTYNDRFVLRYLPQEDLSIETPILESNSVVIMNANNQITVSSTENVIDEVFVYDLQGRLLIYQNKVNAKSFTTRKLNVNNQVVLVKVILDGNKETVKKVIIN